MPPTVPELLAAMPAEEDCETPHIDRDAQLSALFAALATRAAPTSGFRRLCSLGGLQAQLGIAYTAHWLRGWFQKADARQKDLAQTHLNAAVKTLATMGHLRGLIMKLGQTLGQFPDIVPDEFVELLSKLHFDAPPMHFSLLREMVVNELGKEPEEWFAEFDTTAFAAASLGQVHAARLKSGERVAVKIQYPGIARTIRSDFRNLLATMLPLRLSRDWDNLQHNLDDLRRVIEQETDYIQEANHLRHAATLFGEDDQVVIPRVHDALSTRRILTMDFIDGQHLDAFLADNPSQARRDHYGTLIQRAMFRIFFRARWNYPDVHPGNFFFLPDGRLGMIDFGCVRPYKDEEWDFCREYRQALFGPRDEWVRITKRGALFDDARDSADRLELVQRFTDWSAEPTWHGGDFDFGDPDYLRRGIEVFSALSRRRYTRSMTMSMLTARYMFGAAALYYQLKARIPVKALGDEEAKVTGWDDDREGSGVRD